MALAPRRRIAWSRWLPLGVQYRSSWRNDDDRVEEAVERLDHFHQPLDVRVRRVALIGRGLDAIDRQRDDEDRRAAKGVAIGAEDCAAVAFDDRRQRLGLTDAGAVSAGDRPIDAAACFFRRTALFFLAMGAQDMSGRRRGAAVMAADRNLRAAAGSSSRPHRRPQYGRASARQTAAR